jgi:hypothetical protein
MSKDIVRANAHRSPTANAMCEERAHGSMSKDIVRANAHKYESRKEESQDE